MKVLISAPSLNENENVSGVSQVVKQIYKTENINFTHFRIGSPDGYTHFVGKILRNLLAVFAFIRHMLSGNIDLYHSNTALNPNSIVRDAIFVFLGRVFRKPILLHLHGGAFVSEQYPKPICVKVIKFLFHHADRIVVLSEREATSIRKWYGAEQSAIRIINNCIDEAEIAEKREAKTASEPISFLFLARFSEEKGINEIVEAFRSLSDISKPFRLVMCGDGPLKEEACGNLERILGKKFDYRGIVTGKEKQDALSTADYFLLPSRFEGMPVALLEAMGAGVVPIASDISTIKFVMGDNTGVYVKPSDIDSLKSALRSAINKEIHWSELSDNARNRISSKYKCSMMREKLYVIYAELTTP